MYRFCAGFSSIHSHLRYWRGDGIDRPIQNALGRPIRWNSAGQGFFCGIEICQSHWPQDWTHKAAMYLNLFVSYSWTECQLHSRSKCGIVQNCKRFGSTRYRLQEERRFYETVHQRRGTESGEHGRRSLLWASGREETALMFNERDKVCGSPRQILFWLFHHTDCFRLSPFGEGLFLFLQQKKTFLKSIIGAWHIIIL